MPTAWTGADHADTARRENVTAAEKLCAIRDIVWIWERLLPDNADRSLGSTAALIADIKAVLERQP